MAVQIDMDETIFEEFPSNIRQEFIFQTYFLDDDQEGSLEDDVDHDWKGTDLFEDLESYFIFNNDDEEVIIEELNAHNLFAFDNDDEEVIIEELNDHDAFDDNDDEKLLLDELNAHNPFAFDNDDDQESYFPYDNDDDSPEVINAHQPAPLSSPTPSDLNHCVEIVCNTHVKLTIAAQVDREIMSQINDVNALEVADGGRHIPILQYRIAMLTTSLYMFRQYQLRLTDNLLRAKAILGMPVSAQTWQHFYSLVDNVQERYPNVHDMFLRQETHSRSDWPVLSSILFSQLCGDQQIECLLKILNNYQVFKQ